jgi:L-arabinose transport system substrate-binding protein
VEEFTTMAHPTTRRSRVFLAAAAVTTLSLALAGPAVAQSPSAPAGEGPLFVAINKSADQQYFIDLQTAFKAKIEELGGQAVTYDAKLDPNLGVSLVNDAISLGAKGIAITVPDQTIGPAVAQAAADADVALVATDDNIADSAGTPVPFVGFNGTDMGTKVGQAAAELLTASGWLADTSKKVGVLSTEVQTLSVCEDRTNASKQAMLDAGVPAENIFQVPYTGQTDSSQEASGPVITAHPDVTNWIVFACNDEGVVGVLNSLAAAGVSTDNVIAVGLGAYEACKPWAAQQPSGFKAALFISGLDVGAAAAQVLWDNVVNGVELPANTIAPTTIVDPATYADVLDPISLGNCSA